MTACLSWPRANDTAALCTMRIGLATSAAPWCCGRNSRAGLFDRSNVPELKDNGVRSLLTARPPPPNAAPETTYFQGMLDVDRSEFSFVLANLTEEGYLNFNVLHTPHRVSEVDPGPSFGVNQINELRPGEAVTVSADQRTQSAMILTGLKAPRASDGSSQPVLVRDDEQKQVQTGLYFHLSVVPDQASPQLIRWFGEGTQWECVPYFVGRAQAPKTKAAPAQRVRAVCGTGLEAVSSRDLRPMRPMGDLELFQELEDAVDDAAEPQEVSSNEFALFGAAGIGLPRTRGVETSLGMHHTYSARGGAELSRGGGGMRQLSNQTVLPGAAPLVDSEAMSTSVHAAAACAAPSALRLHAPVDVGQSQAAKLEYGQRIEVQAHETGRTYAYEHPSCAAVLSLSLFPHMQFTTLPDLQVLMQLSLEELASTEGRQVVSAFPAIYKSDHCVIDLESPADTVIAQCGHQCINHRNCGGLTKCPLCRRHIDMFIRADTFAIVR